MRAANSGVHIRAEDALCPSMGTCWWCPLHCNGRTSRNNRSSEAQISIGFFINCPVLLSPRPTAHM
eukprot:12903401-Prorocentrum_lima.AAC.1